MQVRIECQGNDRLDISALEPFQGNLKNLSQKNYEKLKKDILTLGFSEPISVWKSDKLYILNGHQRLRVLTKMREDGIEIPPIPVSFVEAKDKKEAKKKVLALASQFGEVSSDGLYEFLELSEIDFKEIEDMTAFPEIDLGNFESEFYDNESFEQDNEDKQESDVCKSCGKKL